MGAPIDIADGYIHFSTQAQCQETADKHFSGYQQIVVARFDVEKLPLALKASLKWEPSRGGVLFPHLYAALPLGAVEGYRQYTRIDTGFALDGLETL